MKKYGWRELNEVTYEIEMTTSENEIGMWFSTFREAKREAIKTLLGQIRDLRLAIEAIRSQKKHDWLTP